MTTFDALGLPIFEATDKIAATGDGLREDLNLIGATARTAIQAEGVRAEGAAKTYADTKDTSNRTAWAAADTAKLAEAKAYTDERDEAYRTVDRALWRTEDDGHQAAAEANAKAYADGAFLPRWKATTAYTAGQQVVAPNGDVVTAKIAFTSGTTYSAANWDITVNSALRSLGVIPDGTDVNTLRTHGYWIVSTTAKAGTLLNYPTTRAGVIKVFKDSTVSATIQEVTAYVSTTGKTEQYSRGTLSATNTSWSPWFADTWNQGLLPDGTNLQTYRTAGAFQISSITAANTMLDWPADAGVAAAGPATLEVITGTGTSRALQRLTVEHAGNLRVFVRSTGLSNSWPAWQEIGEATGGGAAAPSDPVSDHASRVEYARSRRGGGTGTGGKPVVMIRFDHWLLKFRDVILPIMREHSLPGTLNVNYDNLSNVQNGGGAITWAHVQDWNQYDGIEIANHGATHTDASTRASIYHEIVEGRRLLETAMPRVAVETWHEHGSAYLTASDMPGDIGLNLGREPKNFFESYAGKLVMAEHAVVEGKCGGFFVPLTGEPQIGQSHMSIDRDTAADSIAQVETAKALGRGVTLYVHPGLMDTVLVGANTWAVTYNGDGSVDVADPAGSVHYNTQADFEAWATAGGHTIYMRTQAFDDLCAYLAAEREAGNIMVMTSAGGAFADKSHSYRENLLVKPGFTTGYGDWWTGVSGWTITNPGPNVELTAPATTGTLSHSMLLHSRFGWAMGAAHELVVRVRSASAASLTLRVEKLGDPATWMTEKVHAIPGDGVEREYRLNLTLPRDPNITQMAVKITGTNSLVIEGEPQLVAI